MQGKENDMKYKNAWNKQYGYTEDCDGNMVEVLVNNGMKPSEKEIKLKNAIRSMKMVKPIVSEDFGTLWGTKKY